MTARLRIGVTGPIAARNLGDYGMFINNLLELGDSHEYVAFTYDREFLKILKEHYLKGFSVADYEVNLRASDVAADSLWTRSLRRCRGAVGRALHIPCAPKNAFETPLELLRNVENYDEIRQAVESIDVLVVSGGGYLNKPWYGPYGRHRLFRILAPVLFGNALGKKIVFTGNTYGPFDDALEFFRANLATLDHAVFGYRDDLLSPLNLKAIGIERERTCSLPDDLCILHDGLPDSRANLPEGPYLALELYYPLEYVREHVGEIRAFVEQMYARYRVRTLFLPFRAEDGGEIQAKFLEENIDGLCFERWNLDQGFLRLEDARKLIAGAAAFVTNRYHGVVLAVSARTPVVNMLKKAIDYRYYYTKNQGFLNRVFGGLNLDDRFVIRTSMHDAFGFVIENFNVIQKTQHTWTSSPCYEHNLQVLGKRRRDFFQKNVVNN